MCINVLKWNVTINWITVFNFNHIRHVSNISLYFLEFKLKLM
jgi:hypothetical protein